jgi:hypothetical protein
MIQLYKTALARGTNFPYSSVSPSRTQPGPLRSAVLDHGVPMDHLFVLILGVAELYKDTYRQSSVQSTVHPLYHTSTDVTPSALPPPSTAGQLITHYTATLG